MARLPSVSVKFAFHPLLSSVRRLSVPRAKYQATNRTWRMSASDAASFVAQCDRIMQIEKQTFAIWVDSRCHVIGSEPPPVAVAIDAILIPSLV